MNDSAIAVFEDNQELLASPDWLYNIDGLSRGRINIRIGGNGDWFHDETRIERLGLIRLLESSLLYFEDSYFLRAPEQILKIQVDDCPFVISDFELLDKANFERQILIIKTISGITRRVGSENPLMALPLHREMAENSESSDSTASPPVVLIRDGMYARFNRNSYYRLVEAALSIQENLDLSAKCSEQLMIRSSGESFYIS